MRHFSTEDTYIHFFNDIYKSQSSMITSFLSAKRLDKDGSNKNKTYIVPTKGWFNYEDIKAYFEYQRYIENIIHKAKDIIVELSAMCEFYEIKGYCTKITKILNIPYHAINSLNFGADMAFKIIDNFRKLLFSLPKKVIDNFIRDYKNFYRSI